MHFRRPVCILAKPFSALADAIHALPQTAANRPADLLHTTLLPLGDRAAMDADTFATIGKVLDSLTLSPFRLVFDRIRDSGSTISLRPSEALPGAIAFQRALVAALEGHGLRIAPRYDFRPHVTLAYRGVRRGEIAIDPISWLVEDVRLIESVVGETRHIEHGRWILRETDSVREAA